MENSLYQIVDWSSTQMERTQIKWDEIRRVQADYMGNGIVFKGEGKQLVVPGRSMWMGKDKKPMIAFMNEQLEKRNLVVEMSNYAGYAFSRNTKVK